MRSIVLAAAVVALLLVAGLGRAQAPHVAGTPPRSPADERRAFHLPPGFEVQLVAAEPDIHKPLNLAFDDRGRLWVTDTVEYPYPAGPDKKPRDTVKILEDFGPDGRARKVSTFADGLNIPIGVLPLPDARSAMVYSIPRILRLADTKGTGHAGERRVLYEKYGFRDTHGMTSAFTWGFDGWVYACHGFSNTSEVQGRDGARITMQSGNIYRMKPDGSHVEAFTHGQVNPFGLCFDPLGNLYSADCHSQPIYQLLRGACYPSFGRPHDGLGFGPEMFTGYKGSTAIAGCCCYAADHFPAPYRDTVFIGDVVTNHIVQFRLHGNGSTPRATQHEFLRSDDPWFRPVTTVLGPDGALYVADFYNRIIGHYEVPLDHPGRDRERGRIWRIVYRGKDGQGTPAPRTDWTTASVTELVEDLAHPNLTVRTRAANQLATRGGTAGVQAVRAALANDGKDERAAWQRAHGLWVLQRCGALDEKTLAAAARHASRLVRVHAQHLLAARPTWTPDEWKLARIGLTDPDAHVQRAAADALGLHPAIDNVRPLLDRRHRVPAADTHLLHVVRMALRDQLQPAGVLPALMAQTLDERDRRALADVALGVPGPEAAAFLLDFVRRFPEPQNLLTRAVHHAARHGSPATVHGLFAFARNHRPNDLGRQAALLRAIERGTQERGAALDPAVRAWAEDLAGKLLDARQPGQVQVGVELVGALRLSARQDRLAALAGGRRTPEGVRTAALNALAALDAARHAGVLGRVLADGSSPVGLRETSANLLARANQPATRDQLLQALPTVPARLQNVIANGLVGSREGAEKLLAAVGTGKASARLLQERPVTLRLHALNLPGLKGRLEKLTHGLPPADQHIQDLLTRRREGFRKAKADAAAGARVFEKSCAICHQVGGKGARIGPQLDGIGVRGLDRLLEDTLDPNRNVDQAFRLTSLALKKGQVVSGLLLKEEGAVLVLADQQGKEVRVSRQEVDERSTSQLSPMPANLAEQISDADFYHLLAFLLQQRPAPLEKPGGR